MNESTTNTAIEIFGSSFEKLSGDILSAIATILPYALSVAGTALVIFLGWKLFKRLTK